MTGGRRHDVDDGRAPARASVADQFGLQLAGYRRLEIAALDDERAVSELGQQAPAGGTPDFSRVDRHGGRKVPAGASPKVASESFFCRFFRRQPGDRPCLLGDEAAESPCQDAALDARG